MVLFLLTRSGQCYDVSGIKGTSRKYPRLHFLLTLNMSLYSYNFQLLPRPPRSVFSLGPESTRAILPDFGSVAQLSEFNRRLVVLQLSPNTFIQAKVGASFTIFLLCLVVLIVSRKIYEGSNWFFRIIKRPEGNILVVSSSMVIPLH
jgi:hypothetical protein